MAAFFFPTVFGLVAYKGNFVPLHFTNPNRTMTNKPTFVSRDMMTADEGYVQWMADIKQRFRQSQLKAVVRVNTAMLEFYWSVGRDLVALRAE
ncbi:MAG: hypothetical protein IJK85_10150 [Bacteroidales bacterium]|nr:hypothetical protein [Bacteroidales bacterium]